MLRIYVTSQTRYPIGVKEIKKRLKAVLEEKGVSQAELAITLVGERKMRELARVHLNEVADNETHEVLSFPSNDPVAVYPKGVNVKGFSDPEGDLNLGDIIICYPEARKIAIKRNRMMDEVIGELAEHGVLHLLGIHHD